MLDLSTPVAVVSHDAGGAEILSSYVVQQGLTCNYSLAGPALKIFERKLGPVNAVPLEEAIRQSDRLLCGTSWQSDLEWQAIKMARQQGKRSVAFLDHWVNYRERFIRGGETCLPDEIWVGDDQAKTVAQRVLPEVKTRQVGNPYFDDLKRELAAMPAPGITGKIGLNVLFVSAPVREHGLREFGNERHFGYTEEDALRYFLSNLHIFERSIGRIVIRPHPSEPLHKYDWVKEEYQLPIVNGGNRTLLEEIVESDVVVGFESMAMVVGLLAGKRVISCIPPGGNASTLPQPGIEHLQLLS
jgi:hypothetical protein